MGPRRSSKRGGVKATDLRCQKSGQQRGVPTQLLEGLEVEGESRAWDEEVEAGGRGSVGEV